MTFTFVINIIKMADLAIQTIQLYKKISCHLLDDNLVNIVIVYLEKGLLDVHNHHSIDQDEIRSSCITKVFASWPQYLDFIHRRYSSGHPQVSFYYEKHLQDLEDFQDSHYQYILYSFIPTCEEWFVVENISREEETQIKNCLIESKSWYPSLDFF